MKMSSAGRKLSVAAERWRDHVHLFQHRGRKSKGNKQEKSGLGLSPGEHVIWFSVAR